MSYWSGRRVFLTGHTGFKGSWLSLRLADLGAAVIGYALPPETEPSAYALLDVSSRIHEHFADIRDEERLRNALVAAKPQVVIHMAAAALVRRSYRQPLRTFQTNVLGTVNLLEAVRSAPSVETVLIVTSDKVYANTGSVPHLESAPLGGGDPYSASKACAEIVTAAYRDSFADFPRTASARAGNVIGGGDWSEDRLIPDLVRASVAGASAVLRYPRATRPWQHVADVLDGYLSLLEALARDAAFARAWNFGPADGDLTVGDVARRFLDRFDPACSLELERPAYPERAHLALSATSARELLGWSPRYDADAAISATAEWYVAWRKGDDLVTLTRAQMLGANALSSITP